MNDEIKALVLRYISKTLANICLENNVVLIESTTKYLSDNKWLYSEKKMTMECNAYIKIEVKSIDENIVLSMKRIACELFRHATMNPCYLVAYSLKGINKNKVSDWYCCRLIITTIKHRDAFVMLQHPTQQLIDILFDYFDVYFKHLQFKVVHTMPTDQLIIHVVDMKDTPLSIYLSGSEVHCGYVPDAFYITFQHLTLKLKKFRELYKSDIIYIRYTSKIFIPEMRLDESGTVPRYFSIDSLVLNFIVSLSANITAQ